MRQHVLDTNALHRFLFHGEGEDIVTKVLKDSSDSHLPLLMSAVNWGELHYTVAKRIGLIAADGLLANLAEQLGIQVIAADRERAVRAATLKAKYNLPYGDAFAAELTGTQNVLVTADVKDFKRVPKLRLLKLPPKRTN
jgi:predicted nucleic acid-binding protein